MKSIGFLSFGHWGAGTVPTAKESIQQTVELAVAAEEQGVDGAWIRVHHYENNLSSPFPLLAAMGARTSKIELGTGVIAMRYENPLYMAELAATADLISDGRLQLGVSRGSPEPALDGPGSFGYPLPDGVKPVEDAAERIALFRRAISGHGIADANPAMTGHRAKLMIQPQSPGLKDRIWYGAGNIDSARIAGELGMNLMSSTLILEATGESLGTVQARQIEAYREGWAKGGWPGEGRVSVSRSIMPIIDDETQMYFGGMAARDAMGGNEDQIGMIDGVKATFGKTYVGEVDALIEDLRNDEGIAAADTLLVATPNQLGVDLNARVLGTIKNDIGGALGWK